VSNAYIQRISVAVPDHGVHSAFVAFATGMLASQRERAVFERLAARSGIERRHSVLAVSARSSSDSVSAYDFYRKADFPGTKERMQVFEQCAPKLLYRALDALKLNDSERARVKHVIVTCCTGHYAPGLDFATIDYLGLDPEISRTMVGFMGCYAAINGLRLAQSIVRSQPNESVLLVNLELCSLHLQETQELNEMLSFLIFADGCSAALIGSQRAGFAIDSFRSIPIPDTRDLITWRIGDGGFLMHLSGKVPGAIEKLVRQRRDELPTKEDTALWAVHPGGRTVLDAVEQGFLLDPDALAASRDVLRCNGNVSSATVMFVLEKLMRSAQPGEQGFALSFGPGLTAETMRFHAV
jgi:alpha-pyrone synthase